jgi:hypothetical protein
MFSRQLVRGYAKKIDDLKVIASLNRVAVGIDRIMVIPWSNVMIIMGIILAVMLKWPIFGFLQGASQNWLLVSNILMLIMLGTIFTIFVPHNKKIEAILQIALEEGRVTAELSSAMEDRTNQMAHFAEEIIILTIAALIVLKSFLLSPYPRQVKSKIPFWPHQRRWSDR